MGWCGDSNSAIWNALSWACHFNLKNGGNAIPQDISVKGKHHDIYKLLKHLIIWNEYRCMAKSIAYTWGMLSIQSSISKGKDNKLFKNILTLINVTCFTLFFASGVFLTSSLTYFHFRLGF